VTWASIFPEDPKPTLNPSVVTSTGTQFFTRFLNRGDMIRYDLLSTDGVATGLDLEIIGRVMSMGSTPIGSTGFGTGSTGAPTGTSAAPPGASSTGIAAQFLM